jgi:hypothetical protein
MRQNRQTARDRLEAAHDYEVSQKAGLEIRSLHEKLDQLERALHAEPRPTASWPPALHGADRGLEGELRPHLARLQGKHHDRRQRAEVVLEGPAPVPVGHEDAAGDCRELLRPLAEPDQVIEMLAKRSSPHRDSRGSSVRSPTMPSTGRHSRSRDFTQGGGRFPALSWPAGR